MKKNYLLFYFLLFISFSFYGQVQFERNVVIDNSFGLEYPAEINAGDLNNDGFNDIIVLGRRAAWIKNENGTGAFSKLISFSEEAIDPTNLNVVDMDNDGDLDVFFSDDSLLSGTFLFENIDGLGTFSEAIQISETIIGSFSQAIDMDNDGDIDIIYGGSGTPIGWLENLNDNFTFEQHGLISGFADGFYAVDVDNDNLPDIIQDLGYDLRLYKFNSDGSVTFLDTLNTFALLQDYKGADIDDDGDNDLLVFYRNGNTRQVHLYENEDGQGTFSSRQILFDLADTSGITGLEGYLTLFDVDDDGLIDIVKEEPRLGSIHWYKNLGNNAFSEVNIINDNVPNPQGIQLTDIDNDGFNDILLTSWANNEVMWLKHLDGNGNFGDPIDITSFARTTDVVAHKDIDGDGDLDLISSSPGNNRVAWYENTDGLGSFSNQQEIISAYAYNASSLLVFDVDGDTDNDVIVITKLNSSDERKILWFENDGSGSFSDEQVIHTTEDILTHMKQIDFDDDNDVDIYAVVYPNTHLIFENNNGVFAEPYELLTPVTNSFSVRSGLFEDMDQDGDQDLLISYDIFSNDNDLVVWHENSDGQGTFSTIHTVGQVNGSTGTIQSADINNDNYLDVIYGKYSGGSNIGYFLSQNAQSTSFDDVVIIDSEWPQSGVAMHMLDIDNDGDQDIISSSQVNIDRLIWYPNDGSANFGSPVTISSFIENINHISSADINNDSKIDLIVANIEDHRIAWYKNLGVFSNMISGTVRLDANANGCDGSDEGIPNILVTATNGSNTFSTFTGSDGSYTLQANQANFTVSIANEQLPNFYTSDPGSREVDFTSLQNSNLEANFCASATLSKNDVSISLFGSQDDPRPGFDTRYQIVYSNNGTAPLSGTISLDFDGNKLQFLSASASTSSESTNAISFNYTDLDPFETRTIDLEFNVFPPPTTNIDDVLEFTANITPLAGDETQEDNSYSLEQIVIGSYDPNDIRVLEGSQILIDDIDKYLHYIIRFQNTGTASAINVNVEHTLDQKLEWSSMKLQSLSHDGVVEIRDGNQINFKFDNINLPDSTSNEAASHGHIAFKIKPRSNVEIGDVFSGVADIFFDFNPPITTNTITTRIVNALSTTDEIISRFSIYPNPSKKLITLSTSEAIESAAVFDIQGRELMSIAFDDLKSLQEIDIGSLSKGIYFIRIKSGDKIASKKFIKK